MAQVARDLGIPENVLYRWTAQYRQAEAEKLARVRWELPRVTQERDFLRRAAAIRRYPIRLRCRALAVSPADYYAWSARPEGRDVPRTVRSWRTSG